MNNEEAVNRVIASFATENANLRILVEQLKQALKEQQEKTEEIGKGEEKHVTSE